MVLVLTRSPKNISLFQNKFLCYFLLFTLATFVQIILNFGNFPKNLTISYWHLTKYLNFPPKILFIFSLFSHWLISWRECGWVRDMNSTPGLRKLRSNWVCLLTNSSALLFQNLWSLILESQIELTQSQIFSIMYKILKVTFLLIWKTKTNFDLI